jgi:hypothetical protein
VSEAAYFSSAVHGEGVFALFKAHKAYMDESGIHQGSPVCVVAGFVASVDRCDSLEYAWKQLLRRHKVGFFHSKEFSKLKGVFRDWGAYQKSQFTADALTTLSRTMNDGAVIVGAAVGVESFLTLSEDQRNWLTGGCRKTNGKWQNGAPKKPYFLPFQQCVVDSAISIPKGELIHFVFDQQSNFEPSGKRIFALLSNQHDAISERLGDIVYTSKKRANLLQVADFLAYESWQYLTGNRPKVSNDPSQTGAHPIFNRNRVLTMIRQEDLSRMIRENPIESGRYFSWPVRSTVVPPSRIYVSRV